MQYKQLNTYKIAREDNSVSMVNAPTINDAIDNLYTFEKTSPVVSIILVQKGVRTLVEELPTAVDLHVYVDNEQQVLGCKATPESAILHCGDLVQLRAFPSHGYSFLGWKLDGEIISTDPIFTFKVPEIEVPQHYNKLNILAEFEPSTVNWKCEVFPPEVINEGCIAGASKGSGKPGTDLELIACPSDTYKFDGWFRNDVELSKDKYLKTTLEPLDVTEKEAVYIAKFSLKE